MEKKPEFIICFYCKSKTEKKSHNQKYCLTCINIPAKTRREKKKNLLLNPQKDKQHEEYKRIVCNMLLNFYVDINNRGKISTPEDLIKFIEKWVEKHIKSPVENWNPIADE